MGCRQAGDTATNDEHVGSHGKRLNKGFAPKVGSELISLCNLCVLCVSVVDFAKKLLTTEAQRTQRLHREERASDFWGKAHLLST